MLNASAADQFRSRTSCLPFYYNVSVQYVMEHADLCHIKKDAAACCTLSGEYRIRTDGLLHAMQAL